MKRIFLIITLIIVTLSSCYTPPDPGIGIVRVLDNGYRVPSAYIKLTQPGQTGTGNLLIEGWSDWNGEFTYTHQPHPELYQTHDVIFNVYVQKDGKTGTGILEVRVNEVNTSVIIL